MIVKIKKLREDAVLPSYNLATDAGMDLVAVSSKTVVDNGAYIEYGTGLAIEIPNGHVGLLFPRSSISATGLVLGNSVGIVDSGYRGELKFRFKEVDSGRLYHIGDKIGQLVILPYPKIVLEVVDELSESDRNENGFGSSGR